MIIRAFPRRTAQTPDDEYVFIGDPPCYDLPAADEVHISVTFTWDIPAAEGMAEAWSRRHPVVRVGGPAFGDAGDKFVPGRYIKSGITFTSRGCPNSCWFCYVPKREGALRCIPIIAGNIVQDNNLLACPDAHFFAVIDMLSHQRGIQLSGGLEAKRLTDWHISGLARIRKRIRQLFLAYDRENEFDSVRDAIRRLSDAGFSQRKIRCFVLVGYPGDTTPKAESRLNKIFRYGGLPFAMYYRGDDGKLNIEGEWRAIVRKWTRPAAMFAGGDR